MLRLSIGAVISLAISALIFELSGPLDQRSIWVDSAGIFFLMFGSTLAIAAVTCVIVDRRMRHD